MPHHSTSSGPSRLPRAELLWKSLTDSIDCFVLVIGPDYRVQYINRVEEGLLLSEVIGHEIFGFIEPEHVNTVRLSLDEVFSKGRTVAYEVQGKDSKGNPSAYSVRISPVHDDGQVVAAVSTALDTRRLRSMEASLRAERQVLRQLLALQERERQLVSYEIHDGLTQYLAGAAMMVEAYVTQVRSLREPVVQESLETLDEGLRLIHAAVDESRRLINGLRPPMLDELGVLDAVESLVAEAKLVGLSVGYERPDSMPRLGPDVETTMFRIIQESLSNVRKHASASQVVVRVELVGNSDVAISVTDDGVGFDIDTVPKERFGLEGIRQRARLFGRDAKITSLPGQGSRIEVVLPRFATPLGAESPPSH